MPFQWLLVALYPNPFGMPPFRLSRTPSRANLAKANHTEAGGSTSDDFNLSLQVSESKATIRPHPWRAKGLSTTGNSSPFQWTLISPSTASSVDAFPTPDPAIPSVHLNGVAAPSPERIPATDAVSDKLAEAWDAVKDVPEFAHTSRAIPSHAVGVSVAPSLSAMR